MVSRRQPGPEKRLPNQSVDIGLPWKYRISRGWNYHRSSTCMYTGGFAITWAVICALRFKILMHIIGRKLDGLLGDVSDAAPGGELLIS